MHDGVFADLDAQSVEECDRIHRSERPGPPVCATPNGRSGAVLLHIEADDATLAGALAAAAFSTLGDGIAQLDARHLRSTHQADNQRLRSLLQQLRLACRDAALCTQVMMLIAPDALIGNDERNQIDLVDSVLGSILAAAPYCVVVNGPARRISDVVTQHRRQGARLFQQVIDDYGGGAKYSNVTNLCVLFHGPPGTGKTMDSSIIANELSLPLSHGSTRGS